MKRVMNKYGIAVALLACAAVVAGTWLLTDGQFLAETAPTPTTTSSAAAQSEADNSQSLQEALDSQRSANPTVSAAATNAPVSQALPDLVKPVNGDITKPFAYDKLIYMKTLNQWSTHPGVDIAATIGDDVVAALGGEVEDTYKDPMLGNCIKIKCANDVSMIYAGLLSIEDINKGDKVEAGELIGQVGNTATSEITEDPHLHFEVWSKDVPVDPEAYFKK